jgi:hypothetical protein
MQVFLSLEHTQFLSLCVPCKHVKSNIINRRMLPTVFSILMTEKYDYFLEITKFFHQNVP